MTNPRDLDLYIEAIVRDVLHDNAPWPLFSGRRDTIRRQIMQRVRDLLVPQGGGGPGEERRPAGGGGPGEEARK